jgi:hypothetical protein
MDVVDFSSIHLEIDETVSVKIIESSYEKWLSESERTLTMWIE